MTHNNQKKIAAINDYSGFGRCSIAVELPIISALKVQCCPVPTSILSNHTGFESFFFKDFTDSMQEYINEWKKLDLHFDGICTGFLGSHRQIAIVEGFFESFKTDDNKIIIDPVMGDYGKIYPTYTKETCQEMKKLIKYADIITPNLTEACILTDEEYNVLCSNQDLLRIARKLSDMGPEKIVITGIQRGQFIANYCYEKGKEGYMIKTMKVGTQRSGTGDIFAAIIAADAVNGVNFHESVRKASSFIKKCILKSIELDIPVTDGVCFEELLTTLK
ncbi:MAG: pyridoxamine kinase [Lachnospira sp.]|nr:pyridoxamine kinase [Lachnospira sp.]MDD5828249.1 pyridoxamine kinase [Lachnospira sp.]